jgi:uncharacterized Zn-finger protein
MPNLPPPETITVAATHLYCEGTDGAGGHPRVYLTMGTAGQVDCPYCDRRFVLDLAAKAHSHH